MKKEKSYEFYTDASFDNITKMATYAIVIIKENKIIKTFAKRCKISLENSTECEIYAVFQAIKFIEKNLINKNNVKEISLRTDCNAAQLFFSEKGNEKIFRKNLELAKAIRDSYQSVLKKMDSTECNFKIDWISRKLNKEAHKCAYSELKNFRIKEYKKNIIILEKNELSMFLQKFDSKQCKILIYLHLIANENKIIIKTQKEVAKALELPIDYISKTFKKFNNLKMLKKISNGKYSLTI